MESQITLVNPTDAMRRLYDPIADSLDAVDRRLHHELQSRYESIVPVLRHGTQLGGKRLRPALCLLSGMAVAGETRDEHIVMATVLELVHTATLVHDDVLDTATVRRHVPTINARWNSDTSILLGDYLFAQSFSLAASLPSTLACRWVGEAARAVCEGELRQVLARDWREIDEETYLDILRGKTAELTKVACRLGGHLAGGDHETVEALGNFGNDLGIAFQIADDYLDVWGDDEKIGKTLGTDLAQGKLTLPLIRLLNAEDADLANRAAEVLRAAPHERAGRIMPLLRESDAAEYTRETARRFQTSAIESIRILRPSAAKDSLISLAEFSVNRRF